MLEFNHRRRGVARRLSLIELLVAASVLLIVLVGFGVLTSGSVQVTQGGRSHLLAQDSAVRIQEYMRSIDRVTAANRFWLNATQTNIGGVTWATSFDATGNALLDRITQAAAEGRIQPPSDNPAFVRIHFFSEADYDDLWGVVANLDGTAGTSNTFSAAYNLMPYVIEVRWTDESGTDRVYQLKGVLGNKPRPEN